MAIYDFKCDVCGKMVENLILPMTHSESDKPVCHGQPMGYHITKAPMVHWRDGDLPDGGFKAWAIPGAPVVTSKRQNRELMKRHNLIDGNDLPKPVTKEEQIREHREKVLPSIKKIMPDERQAKDLKRLGLDSIVK